MRKLGERLARLEAANPGAALRMVWMDAGKTEPEAVAAYDPARMGIGDKIMFVSWEGGCDATG